MTLLNIQEVQKMLRLSEVTIWRKLKKSRNGEGRFPLPVTDRGEKIYWNADDIDSYLNRNRPAVNAAELLKQKAARERATDRKLRKLGIEV
jgi:predicted DNA-binding transcriptional regulator AlpA